MKFNKLILIILICLCFYIWGYAAGIGESELTELYQKWLITNDPNVGLKYARRLSEFDPRAALEVYKRLVTEFSKEKIEVSRVSVDAAVICYKIGATQEARLWLKDAKLTVSDLIKIASYDWNFVEKYLKKHFNETSSYVQGAPKDVAYIFYKAGLPPKGLKGDALFYYCYYSQNEDCMRKNLSINNFEDYVSYLEEKGEYDEAIRVLEKFGAVGSYRYLALLFEAGKFDWLKNKIAMYPPSYLLRVFNSLSPENKEKFIELLSGWKKEFFMALLNDDNRRAFIVALLNHQNSLIWDFVESKPRLVVKTLKELNLKDKMKAYYIRACINADMYEEVYDLLVKERSSEIILFVDSFEKLEEVENLMGKKMSWMWLSQFQKEALIEWWNTTYETLLLPEFYMKFYRTQAKDRFTASVENALLKWINTNSSEDILKLDFSDPLGLYLRRVFGVE